MITKQLTKSHKKISTPDSKIGNVGYQATEFYHQANAGDTTINLMSMVLPSQVSAEGFVNPSAETIASAKIKSNQGNLSLHTFRGQWMNRIDYSINSNSIITLKQPAQEGEIFHGVIQNIVKNHLQNPDLQQIVAVGTLAFGQTDFNVGKQFRVNTNPLSQIGELQVYRGNNLSLMLRNAFNSVASATADGNYQEVDSGSGWGSIIRFNEAGQIGGELVVVMSTGRLLERPSNSLLQEIEVLAGQIDNVIPYVEELMDLPSGTLKSAPSNADLKAFGDKVISLDNKYNTTAKLSDYTKTRWQKKVITQFSEMNFNNLTVGKTYRFTMTMYNGTDSTIGNAVMNHNNAMLLQVYLNNTTGFAFSNSVVFVASATTLVGQTLQMATGDLLHMTLEELPNHEQTNQWT